MTKIGDKLKARQLKIAKDKRDKFIKSTRRINSHTTKSNYKGGFVYITGKYQTGLPGLIGDKKHGL